MDEEMDLDELDETDTELDTELDIEKAAEDALISQEAYEAILQKPVRARSKDEIRKAAEVILSKKKAVRTSEERRILGNYRKQKSRTKEGAKKQVEKTYRKSCVSVTKNDAREILVESGIKNEHVISVILKLAEIAAGFHNIPANMHLYKFGLRATILARESKDFPAMIEDGVQVGELLSRRELYYLYDFSIFRLGMTFNEWLGKRRICKTDAFLLGRDFLNKDFHEVHKAWSEFFPKFNPDTLPGNYDQEQMKEWLDRQAEKKEFLLLASRNCYKSSFSIVWLVSAILCCPDLRALLVSETKHLAKGFIRSLRSYFENRNIHDPNLFSQLFPEYMIPAGEGSVLSFESPMAHLGLIQPTAESTSMDSTVAGNRADIILFDDPISNVSCGNIEQRQASVDKYDLILKLREVGGYTTILGTPWHREDLYATLLRRNEQDESKPLEFRIDPAWEVKEEARHKELKDLNEEDVILLFPSRLTWKFLQKERRNNERFFLSQNLVQFLDDEEAEATINFDENLLRKSIVTADFANGPESFTAICVDTAWSTGPRADATAISVVKIFNNKSGLRSLAVLETVRGRWKPTEISQNVCRLAHKYNPRTIVLEKFANYEMLMAEITNQAYRIGIPISIFPLQASNQKNAKGLRIKLLEIALANDQLFFVNGAYISDLFAEMQGLNGRPISHKSGTKKDDLVDTLAIAAKLWVPNTMMRQQTEEELAEQTALEDEQRKQHAMRAYHDMIHGTGPNAPRPPQPEPQLVPVDPRRAALQKVLGPTYR